MRLSSKAAVAGVSGHCGLHIEKSLPGGQNYCTRGKPQRGEKHSIQQPYGAETAHGQLARQDRGQRAGQVPV